jgi:hypothetical protein
MHFGCVALGALQSSDGKVREGLLEVGEAWVAKGSI